MKKMHYALRGVAVLACAVFLQPAFAQLPSFTRTYQDLQPLTGRDFNNTNMITSPYYGGTSADKGYLQANNLDNGTGDVIVRLTAVQKDGSPSWSRTYGKYGENVRCFAITHDRRDDGYLLTGYRYNPSNLREDLWLLKVDRDGNAMREFSFNTDSIPCTKQGGPATCQTLHAPHFYGMDILQVSRDPAGNNDQFVVVGFVSEKSSELEYRTLKRNFVWRFAMSPLWDSLSRPEPRTAYLKVFHGLGTGNDEPTDQELADEVQEIPGYGLMILGHTKGYNPIGPVPSPRDGIMFPYYTLLRYDGGGSSIISSAVFDYGFKTLNTDKRNVRTLYDAGKDVVFMLGYYGPTQAFTITPLKPASGGWGTTLRYYTNQTQNVPAFSFYENRSNTDELIVMGYRLGYNTTVQQDYMHPYTIKVKKTGGATTPFNVEQIRSYNYNGYSPADPVLGRDYFKPMEKLFPPVTLPEIAIMNYHIGYEDAVVSGVLHRQLPGSSTETYHASLSQFKTVTEKAECNPEELKVEHKELPLEYDKISWNINLIRFKITRYTTSVRKTGPAYKCDEIPPYRKAPVGSNNTLQADDEVALFPNPASDMVQVQGLAGEAYSYNVVTATGVLVQSGSFTQQTSLPVGNWASGVYIITLRGSHGAEHKLRFIKQ